MPHSDTVQKFLEILGPFYEFVNESEDMISDEQNGHADLTPESEVKENGVDEEEEDDEDYCDTSDTMQQDVVSMVKNLKSKVNGSGNENDESITGEINNNYKVANGYSERNGAVNGEHDVDRFVNKFGGESGAGGQYQARPSRPSEF